MVEGLNDVFFARTSGNVITIIVTLITAGIEALTSALYAASTAAIYYELRHIKEGLAPKAIASVFD